MLPRSQKNLLPVSESKHFILEESPERRARAREKAVTVTTYWIYLICGFDSLY